MNKKEKTLSGQFTAMEEVFNQAIGLFHLLRALAEEIHGHGELTAGRRGVLRGLDRLGPQTVPQMARARPVSRQHIQLLVNQLEEDGLVELAENIAHKRSRLVKLTPQGKAYLEAMYRREAELYTTLKIDIPEETLRSTAEILSSLRDTLLEVQLRFLRENGEEAKPKPNENADVRGISAGAGVQEGNRR